ncbi:MAG: fatty acid hydroxylase [Candidatus Kapabacteria bacterium]|nr:fatty acid hydroxylase [Candidatus Kapabacteria bacterium]
MGANVVSNSNETVRLFENPILEYFSHIHPATPIVVYVPVVAYNVWYAVDITNKAATFATVLAGVVLWTLFEYIMHRWAFHYEPTTDIGKRMHFLVHGVHHDYPRDATRLVMPLLVSVPLALLIFVAYASIMAPYHHGVFAGFILGYVAYDSIHYATHHMHLRGRVGRYLKQHHMTHHYVDGHSAYGVSNPLWDVVFATLPRAARKSDAESSSTR